jgi:ferrous iron transport protein B
MTLLFLSIFTLAEAPMDWIGNQVAALANWVKGHHARGDLRDLLTDGAIAGVGTHHHLPAADPDPLLLHRAPGKHRLHGAGRLHHGPADEPGGLNGKLVHPAPQLLRLRHPRHHGHAHDRGPKDRLVTILVAPLMSCSARLPVYLLMIAALVPGDRVPLMTKVGHHALMYALGTGGAFGFAWLFKRTLLKGKPPLMIMELPPYRLPRMQGRRAAHGRARRPLPEARRHRHPRDQHRPVVPRRLSQGAGGVDRTQQLAQSFAGQGRATPSSP